MKTNYQTEDEKNFKAIAVCIGLFLAVQIAVLIYQSQF